MKFKYLSKTQERKIYDEGIKKRLDYTGKEIITNLHESRWTKWVNYKYDQGVFESHKEWRSGKLRFRFTAKGQYFRLVKFIKKIVK